MRLIWDRVAMMHLQEAIDHIRIDSPQNAEKVKNDILKKVRSILSGPERFTPDKYKLNNDGSHRYFEMHRIRVSFFADKDKVVITRVRHASRDPLYH